MIRLLTLGSADLRRDETVLRSVLSQPKRLALLVYLATASPRGFHSRDTLLAMFWPETDDQRARNALRQALHYLRRSLGDDVIVGRGDWDIGVDSSKLSCDAVEFDEAIASNDFERASALYRGDFMPGFFVEDAPDAEDWLDNERRRRRDAAAEASRRLSEINPATLVEPSARPVQLTAPSAAAVVQTIAVRPSRRWLKYAPLTAVIAALAFFGYRGTRTQETATPAHGSSPAIAVLPFVNMSADTENEYFSDGITEEILNSLVQIQGLRVASRTSSMAYKNNPHDIRKIAADLGVGVVLEGSVRKERDNIRITAQLIDARNGYHLWSQTYDRELRDVLAAQEDIARSISDALKLRLGQQTILALRRRSTTDPHAYDLYLRARYLIGVYSEDRNSKAIEYLKQAITRDPGYALAHAALARAYIAAAEFVPPREVLPKAKQSALRALELDSTLVETRLALARVRQVYDRDWSAAELEVQRAIQLEPNSAIAHNAYSELLLQSRKFSQAEVERQRTWQIRRAETPDTLLPAFRIEQGLSWGSYYLHAGQSRLALERARAAADLDPDNAMAQWMVGTALQQMGRYQEAIPPMARAHQRANALAFLTHLGRAYALAGNRTEARVILDTLHVRAAVRYVPKDQIALMQLALGDTTQALQMLSAAIDDYHWYMPSTNGNHVWRGLWGNPRFEQLMRKLGAPQL